jgi:hypothetical protein
VLPFAFNELGPRHAGAAGGLAYIIGSIHINPNPIRDATPLLSSADDTAEANQPESLRKVLDSRTFAKTPALRALLTYLLHHRGESISEYAIATEALGRSSLFDARTDATVRVQISRLRQRLEKFYDEEGSDLMERITIPLGSHEVRLEQVTHDSRLPNSHLEVVSRGGPAKANLSKIGIAILIATTVLLAVTCIVQAILLSQAREASVRSGNQQLSWFWQHFFANGQPTRITLPTPTFFSFHRPGGSEKSTIMYRDTEVNQFEAGRNSPQYRVLEHLMGAATLADNYTVTSDTFASVRLARYLDQFGIQTKVESSANAPLEALDTENVIAVGTWGTLTPLRPYLEHMDFELSPHEDFVTIGNPGPGEPKVVGQIVESPERGIWPGVIALLPGRSGRTRLLILASRHTSALVSFLTSTNGLDQLSRMWKAKGAPEYYEVVVNAELSGRELVRFWPVALHAYKNPA